VFGTGFRSDCDRRREDDKGKAESEGGVEALASSPSLSTDLDLDSSATPDPDPTVPMWRCRSCHKHNRILVARPRSGSSPSPSPCPFLSSSVSSPAFPYASRPSTSFARPSQSPSKVLLAPGSADFPPVTSCGGCELSLSACSRSDELISR
jgi:hypothetical protein